VLNIDVKKGDYALVKVLDTETGKLNIRDCPSAGCTKVGEVASGEILVKEDFQDGWYKILFGEDESGWVFGKYIKEVQ
jgi:uncharacterized protein YgiM (DUF1202 family)